MLQAFQAFGAMGPRMSELLSASPLYNVASSTGDVEALQILIEARADVRTGTIGIRRQNRVLKLKGHVERWSGIVFVHALLHSAVFRPNGALKGPKSDLGPPKTP